MIYQLHGNEKISTCSFSVLTYGTETLTVIKISVLKLQRTQRTIERSMLGVSIAEIEFKMTSFVRKPVYMIFCSE